MKVKDQVLAALEANRGTHLSGEALAGKLSVSRNAVWKAVRQLQEEGHEIQAVTNRGYQLAAHSDRLSVQSIACHLDGLPIAPQVFASLPSTTTHLKQLAEAGAPEGTLIVAEQQTAGYGRFGRPFHSPPDGGLYMSLLLRPGFPAQDTLCITTCAAVAVCRALERLCGVKPGIKWVNDLFLNGKKICGIGTEGALDFESGGVHYAILGIGINLYPSAQPLPPEMQEIVGTVLDRAPQDGALRSRLLAEIIRQFWAEYPRLLEKRFFEDYRDRCFVLGRSVTIQRGGGSETAQVLSLAPDFSLRVRLEDGREELLCSGEVSLRPAP